MENEIKLFGVIGSYWDGITVEQVSESLDSVEDGPLTVHISSPGGDAHEGLGIHSLLSDRGSVSFKAHGLIASAASFIATAGPVEMSAGGIYMLHDAWTAAMGDAAEFRKVADRLDVHSQSIAGLYAAKTGSEVDLIRELMANETWLTAEDALESGFIDEVSGEDDADVSASIRIPKAFGYQHVPAIAALVEIETSQDWCRQFSKSTKPKASARDYADDPRVAAILDLTSIPASG